MKSLVVLIREKCRAVLDAEMYGLLFVLQNGANSPGAYVIWRRASPAVEWGIAFYHYNTRRLDSRETCISFDRCLQRIAQRADATLREVEDGLVLNAL